LLHFIKNYVDPAPVIKNKRPDPDLFYTQRPFRHLHPEPGTLPFRPGLLTALPVIPTFVPICFSQSRPIPPGCQQGSRAGGAADRPRV